MSRQVIVTVKDGRRYISEGTPVEIAGFIAEARVDRVAFVCLELPTFFNHKPVPGTAHPVWVDPWTVANIE